MRSLVPRVSPTGSEHDDWMAVGFAREKVRNSFLSVKFITNTHLDICIGCLRQWMQTFGSDDETFQVKEGTQASAMDGPILSQKRPTELISKRSTEKSPRPLVFRSPSMRSPLLTRLIAEHLLQPPGRQRRAKWKGSSHHGSSGGPLRSTWLYPCPRRGRPPKGRTVRKLNPWSLHKA